jgi:hypothetical protein
MRLAGILIVSTLSLGGCVYVPPGGHCTDGVLSSDESDIDCGGSSCGACGTGRSCGRNADCASNICGGGVCTTGSIGLPSSAGAPVYQIDSGASLLVEPGVQAGYGVLANVGGSFRLVWTGEAATTGTYTTFSGTVWTTAVIDSVTPGCAGQSCALEAGDSVGAPLGVSGGYRVDFDATATVGLDGFDFTVTAESANQPVYFDLYIDGQRYPQLVFFSSAGQAATTASLPFGLTTQ